ncbi:MAG: hypothetical protein KKB30_11330 [Proteobacteria bacterium]|nr:hypothetical protein [Pseudomonadota bacterium]MBU1714358.1 hypothetical protein [Pseudomonadota bacterium]
MSNKQTSIKSKLFKLKEWLTIQETAKHLSIMFGEEVSEADVLRLGLDRHLKLSVNFVNHGYAKRGDTFLPFEEWEVKLRENASWENAKTLAAQDGMIAVYFSGFDMAFYLKDDELSKQHQNNFLSKGKNEELKNSLLNKLSPEVQSELLSNMIEQAIIDHRRQSEKFGGKVPPSTDSFRGKVFTIKDVWDLPMLGTESIDIEHQYQMLTNGPEITLTGLDGAFVEREDGVVFQVQESFDKEWIDYQNSDESKQKSLDFYRKGLDKRIANNEIDEIEAEKLLDQRKKNLDKPRNRDDDFYPAGGLPEDSVLVVRTQALIDLQERLSKTDSDNGSPLDSRAETTYLNIIGAMLETFIHKDHGDVDFPSEAKLREFLSKKYAGFKGLTERTLAEKFAVAKRALNDDLD